MHLLEEILGTVRQGGPEVSKVVVGDNEMELIYSIRRIPQTGFKSRNRCDFGHHDVRMLQSLPPLHHSYEL